LRSVWRKNSPELLGFLNGSLPRFVSATGRGGSLDGVPVYSYHVVEPQRFEADLAFLERNRYVPLSLDQLVDYVDGRLQPTGREVALTFDDGPRNFHDVAFPLLRKSGFQSTVFIAPGLHADDFGEFQHAEFRPMSWDELRALQASGLVSVQSHTLQSQYVPRWPEAAPLAGVQPALESRLRRAPLPMREDFEQARLLIEENCPGARVRHLCYPMYHSSHAAELAARAAGYVAGYGGLIRGRTLVRPGTGKDLLPRMSWEFLRRMPGDGRTSLTEVLRSRIEDARLARSRQAAYGKGS
jgi:peptidoglycan/xylan/chitin deacetylase (PgdA/CDA1 family)